MVPAYKSLCCHICNNFFGYYLHRMSNIAKQLKWYDDGSYKLPILQSITFYNWERLSNQIPFYIM